jgi:hypothetical protein
VEDHAVADLEEALAVAEAALAAEASAADHAVADLVDLITEDRMDIGDLEDLSSAAGTIVPITMEDGIQ